MKKAGLVLGVAVLLMISLGGCKVVHIEEEKRKELDYTVIKQEDIPKEAAALIERKKEKEFQMTYQSGKDLYVMKGYGRQMSGGYSVAVEELSQSTDAIYFKTKLIGPSDISQGGEPSYPYIVVKTAYRDVPVDFH